MKKKMTVKGILKGTGKILFTLTGILGALLYYLLFLVCGEAIYEEFLINRYLPGLLRYVA